MGYIPRDAKWYVADLVVSISVGRRKKVTVHVNTVLIRADSPAEAHEKAHALGQQHEARYPNEKGEAVRLEFLGLGELNVIHDGLEDGCELYWAQTVVHSPASPRLRDQARQAESPVLCGFGDSKNRPPRVSKTAHSRTSTSSVFRRFDPSATDTIGREDG